MRRIFLSLCLTVLSGCTGGPTILNTSPDVLRGTGTIRYQTIEGGFYGIVGDDGTRLDPSNLPSSLAVDSVRVRYLARPRHDAVSFHMWGQIVDLISIEREP